MIGAIGNAIAQIARIFANKTDGDNAIKIHQVKEYRNTDKAMEAAEQHMFSVASFLDGKIDARQLRYLHKKYSATYFRYN